MTEIKKSKLYDLEERALRFAKEVIEFVSILLKTTANIEMMKQNLWFYSRKGKMSF
jgi:hypothetical protein